MADKKGSQRGDKKSRSQVDGAELRRFAEMRLGAGSGEKPRSAGEASRILHELEVHQIELEMQNSELTKARDDMEAMLEKYTDLFEFAPVSYFTLDREGTISSVNLTGASLLGTERSRLNGRRFEHFVAVADRSAFANFLANAFASLTKETCEVVLRKEGNIPLCVQIEATSAKSERECRVTLFDITDRKRAVESLRKEKTAIEALLKMGAAAEVLRKAGEAALVGLNSIPKLDGPVSSVFSSFKGSNNKISQRESEVLQLLVEGNCTKEVASLLNISGKTVEMHRINLMKKLEITSVVNLVKFAIREGITSHLV
jgi:PAS domain S-box-containing protein